MINQIQRSLWMFFSSVLLLFVSSCIQGGNSYSSRSNYTNSSVSNDGNFLSPDKKIPVLRKLNLQTLTIGKNRIEIEELMGAPEGKSLDGGNGFLWDYRRPVFDEATDKVYGWSLVSFKFINGLCHSVNVRLENPPLQLLDTNVKQAEPEPDPPTY